MTREVRPTRRTVGATQVTVRDAGGEDRADGAEETKGVSVVGAAARPLGPGATSARTLGRRRRGGAGGSGRRFDEDTPGAQTRSPDGRGGSDSGVHPEERDAGGSGGSGGDDATTTDHDALSAERRGERGRTLRRGRLVTAHLWLVVTLGAVAIVGAVSAIGFGLAWSNLNSQNDQRSAAQQAATTFVMDLTNFKPSDVDSDFTALENWGAPGSEFAKQSAQTFNSGIRQQLIQSNATSQGQIRNIYVETLKSSNAEVYAVVDQVYQSTKVSRTPDTLRLTLDLSNTSQGWRISTVTVENPSGTPTG
jgi:hypothetical protein